MINFRNIKLLKASTIETQSVQKASKYVYEWRTLIFKMSTSSLMLHLSAKKSQRGPHVSVSLRMYLRLYDRYISLRS